MLDFENVQLKAETTPVSMYSSCLHIVTITNTKKDYSIIYIYLTNRFQVAVRLFSNRSQMTSKCGKNKKVAHEMQPNVSLMFLPHFDVIYTSVLQ